MFNGSVGPLELLIVLAIVLMIFGPKRLPRLGRQLGRGMREFKDSITGDRGGGDDDEDDDDAEQRPAVTAAASAAPPAPATPPASATPVTADVPPAESQAAASEALGREPTGGGPGAA